jgi:hypothetical protein
MKAQERHQLKQNDFAQTMTRVATFVSEHRDRLTLAVVAAVLIVAIGGGYLYWKRHRDGDAGALFAMAMSIYQSPIAPAPTVPGATQAAGTYPTLEARQAAALAAFQKVADAYPSTRDGVAARYEVAGVLLSRGQFAEAEKAYQDVIAGAASTDIYGPVARMGFAATLTAEGKFDQAIKEYNDLAAERDGLLPVDGVLMQLAQTYLKAGKTSDARATFKRVVDEFPASNYVTEAREQLAALG